VYKRREDVLDPIHYAHRTKRSQYRSLIKHAKKVHQEGFLESVDDKRVWTAH